MSSMKLAPEGSGTMSCGLCKSQVRLVYILPNRATKREENGLGCKECAIQRGVYCITHDCTYGDFGPYGIGCEQCAIGLSASIGAGQTHRMLTELQEKLPGREWTRIQSYLDDWEHQVHFNWALAVKATCDKLTIEQVVAYVLQAKCVDGLLPPAY